MKSGFVAIIGKSNVGKSTILNNLIEHKVAIVTDKVQTTRDIIRGIYHDLDTEIVFLDTPGIHKPLHVLGQKMNERAFSSLSDVDAIILVIDASRKENKGDELIYQKLPKDVPLFIATNKIDLITLEEALKLKEHLKNKLPAATIIELEARVGFNIDTLLNEIKKVLPDGPFFYEETQITDKSSSYLVSELIREAVLNLLSEEVPHGVAIYVENLTEEKTKVYIKAAIYVKKESHKPILIGKRGAMIKRIGISSRKAIEEYYHKTVYLDLHVLVKEDWLNSPSILKRLGY